ncbi:MAG: CcmD family protein [Chloroflexota bacterium]|nr:CcmD family protein [Anaerolineales bacterium]MCB8966974.1 CcmD family protein [Ardenticatenaceae bacterium]
MTLYLLVTFLTGFLQAGVGDPNRFNNYLVLGYVVMWLIGLVYVISLASRQRNLQKDMDLMQQLLQEDEEAAEK